MGHKQAEAGQTKVQFFTCKNTSKENKIKDKAKDQAKEEDKGQGPQDTRSNITESVGAAVYNLHIREISVVTLYEH